jgi:hypothetical protein
MKNKYIFILIFLSQSAFSTIYTYKDTVVKEITRGCTDGGGTKEMCKCNVDFYTHNVPQSELVVLNKSMYKLYTGSDTKIPQQHRIWIQKLMNKCKGL